MCVWDALPLGISQSSRQLSVNGIESIRYFVYKCWSFRTCLSSSAHSWDSTTATGVRIDLLLLFYVPEQRIHFKDIVMLAVLMSVFLYFFALC